MKKPKRKTIFVIQNKEFSTFKAFKTFAWYNMKSGETTKGFEIFEDTVIKEYNLNLITLTIPDFSGGIKEHAFKTKLMHPFLVY